MNIKQLNYPKREIIKDDFVSLPVVVGCVKDGIDEGCLNCCAIPNAQQLGGLDGLVGAIYNSITKSKKWNGMIRENLYCLKKIRKSWKNKKGKFFLSTYSGEIALAKPRTTGTVLEKAYKYPMHDFIFVTRLPNILFKKMSASIELLSKKGIDATQLINLHIAVSIPLNKYMFRADELRRFPSFFRKHIWFKPLIGSIQKPNFKGIESVRIAAEKAPKVRECKMEWVKEIQKSAREQGVKVYYDK